jgi:hypothetical protein
MIPSRRSPQVVGSKREWVETLRCRARTGAAAGAASRGRVRLVPREPRRVASQSPAVPQAPHGGGWTGQTGTLRRRGRSRRWKPPAGQRPQCSPAWRVRWPTGGRRARRPEARTERSEPDRGPRPAPCETHALRAGPQGGVEVADRTEPAAPGQRSRRAVPRRRTPALAAARCNPDVSRSWSTGDRGASVDDAEQGPIGRATREMSHGSSPASPVVHADLATSSSFAVADNDQPRRRSRPARRSTSA